MKQLLSLVFAAFLLTACQSSSNSEATTTSSETLTVNPAHGQPGHRCDIAVGAPLK